MFFFDYLCLCYGGIKYRNDCTLSWIGLYNLDWSFRVFLSPWLLLLSLLIAHANLFFSINFSNGMRIVRTLIPRCTHMYIFCWPNSTFFSWTLGFCGATDHITGDKFLFSSLSSLDNLPTVTMVDGSRVLSHDVGTINLFPFLTIDNDLYVPVSPFNLLSISCLTPFS